MQILHKWRKLRYQLFQFFLQYPQKDLKDRSSFNVIRGTESKQKKSNKLGHWKNLKQIEAYLEEVEQTDFNINPYSIPGSAIDSSLRSLPSRLRSSSSKSLDKITRKSKVLINEGEQSNGVTQELNNSQNVSKKRTAPRPESARPATGNSSSTKSIMGHSRPSSALPTSLDASNPTHGIHIA